MSIYLNSNSESLIEFQDGFPVNYSGPLLRGSKVLYSAKDTCQLIIQEIRTELYSLRLNVFRFFETLTLNSVSKREGVHSRVLLKGNLRHRVKGAGKIYLREGEFTMLWAGNTDCRCRFEKNTEYRTMDIFYSPGLNLFPRREIQKGSNPFYFVNASGENNIGEMIKVDGHNIDPSGVELESMVKLHNTLSFMIVRNDTILYEYYAPKYNDSTTVSSFSIAKTFVSTLIGIAIQEGKIKSVHQPITDFIPEFTDTRFRQITIENLLKHTSGIHFSKQRYNPNSDNAQFYYTTTLREKMLESKIEEPPGLNFNYASENYQLLGLIIERTTHQTLSHYLQEKLWKPLGMEHDAFWNTDNKTDSGIEKAFCCLNATTHDFAKLGRLFLNNGNWNGKQILSAQWVKEATQPDTTAAGKFNFQYNWIAGPERYKSYYAAGLYGQYIYVYPPKNIIIVRFGKQDLNYNPSYWKGLFLQIIDQL